MTTLWWVGYVALVGALAAAAAFVVEPVARALRWPTRALWAGALLAQLGAVAWALVEGGPARPHGAFVGAWAVATVAAALAYLRAARLLRRERGRWRVTVAEEMPVWVSERTGPAVVGFLRSIVVAPAWAMAMAARDRRLLLRHEAEHVAAWDPTLLLAGLVACALVPWSPAAWWALARLRLAIEVDCDRRVLRAEPDVAAYGELLVAMSARVEPGAATLAAFAERRLPLEERIEAMTARRPRGAAWRWSARAAAATTLVLAACLTPCPPGMRAPTQLFGGDTVGILAGPRGARLQMGNAAMELPPGSRWKITRDTATDAGSSAASSAAPSDAPARTELLARLIHDHFARPEVPDLAPRTVAFLVIESDGRIVRDVREARGDRADGTHDVTISTADIARRFPDVPRERMGQGGIMDAASAGLDVQATIAYEYLRPPRSAQEIGTLRAVERVFGAAGAPRDTAVGLLVAFAPDYAVLDVRRVPVDSVPATLNVAPAVRERLLPVLRGRFLSREGAATGSVPGLATGSAMHHWVVDEPDDSASMAHWRRRATDAVRAHLARTPFAGDSPVTMRVLFAADWQVRGVTAGAFDARMRVDSVVATFPAAIPAYLEGRRPWLRGGIFAAPPSLGLPRGSTVAWAQLAPPSVERVER